MRLILRDETYSEPQPTEASTLKDVYNVGDVIWIDNNTLIILGWENIEANEFMPPDEGNKFIAVEMMIINDSNSSKSISSMLQMSIKDGKRSKIRC